MRYMTQGGMPGLCFIRANSEREDQIKAWLETTVYRDLSLIPKTKINPEIAMKILSAIAELDEPTSGNIARAIKRDPRVVNTHLRAS